MSTETRDTSESFGDDNAALDVENGTDAGWRKHPIDIRFTLPGIGQRYFVTVIAGKEKRAADRLRADRITYPLRTRANILFFIGFAVAFYGVGGLLVTFFPFW